MSRLRELSSACRAIYIRGAGPCRSFDNRDSDDVLYEHKALFCRGMTRSEWRNYPVSSGNFSVCEKMHSMAKVQMQSNGRHDRDINLIEFSVVFVATSNNPSILNPDFLYHNGIVDASWEVQEPRISTPAYSQVTFDGGLTVKAVPDRVIFEQAGQNQLAEQDIVCPQIAKTYLETIPHVPYRAVGINIKGFRIPQNEMNSSVENALIDKGVWMSYKDTTPDIQVKAIYNYNKRKISLDISNAEKKNEHNKIPGVLFQINIHRDIHEVNSARRIETISSILSSWKEDLSDFNTLVAKFNPPK